MRHHALPAMACVMACCAVANSSQAAFNSGGAQFHGDASFAERELRFVLSLPSSLALVLEP